MSGNKRGYISQEDARCLPGAAAACHPLQSSTLASSLSFVQGKMMGQHTLWRSEKGFNIALTKGNRHRWLMRRMGLHCFADDSFCATLLPDPSPGQLRVVKHSLDYVARMKDKSSCLGKINKKSEKGFLLHRNSITVLWWEQKCLHTGPLSGGKCGNQSDRVAAIMT